MKTSMTMVAATIAAVGLFIPSAHAQFGAAPAELELVRVQDDLYVIYNDFVPGNVTALITDEGVLLVDNKFEIDYDNIMAQLATVTDQPVRYVVNTHYHSDHSGSNVRMQALNAEVFAAENARAKMIEAGQPGLPNVAVEEHVRIYLGGKAVEVFLFGRAHTDGDVVVLFPEHRVLAAGDIFAFGEDTPELIDYAGGGSARAWPKTLDAALQLDFDTVVPGHGVVTTKQEMRNFRDETERLATLVREMIMQGRSRDEIEAMLRAEFNWADLHVQLGLDGLLAEMR
ncbi:MBL fold metallo-hydrolase [Candidatus Rariloculus sp.]|uniref:MBL fold metallo-hydrolase n=1 Tax=Candidatus Rariloculus sp. TaxID=3101265 RepID=UPI003D0D7653